MYNIRAPSLKIFSKWIIFQIRHCKKVHCPLSKFSLDSLTISWPKASRLSPTVQLDLSWTLEMSNLQNDLFRRPSESLSNSLNAMCTIWELLHKNFFSKSLKFKIRYCENFQCPLNKISLHYHTVIDQKLTVFHQLFSWTTVRPSKCPNDKMISLQDHLRV